MCDLIFDESPVYSQETDQPLNDWVKYCRNHQKIGTRGRTCIYCVMDTHYLFQ